MARKKNGLARRLSASQLRALMVAVRIKMGMGVTDLKAARDLKVSEANYLDLKRRVLADDTVVLGQRPLAELYLEYTYRQEANLSALDDVIRDLPANQSNALVGAVRTRSDILGLVIKTGQDMGLIDKAPERRVIGVAVAVAAMDLPGLRDMVREQTAALGSLVGRYTTDFAGKAIDVQFSDTGKPATAGSKGKAAGGRARRTGPSSRLRRAKLTPTVVADT